MKIETEENIPNTIIFPFVVICVSKQGYAGRATKSIVKRFARKFESSFCVIVHLKQSAQIRSEVSHVQDSYHSLVGYDTVCPDTDASEERASKQ
jgi:hypothetical protein